MAEQSKRRTKELREIGDDGVWTLSTAKPGFGAEQIRDGKIDSYWQSDGMQPHVATVQFRKKMQVCQVHLYLDYAKDESYTPARISIRTGTSFHDVAEWKELSLQEPSGWVVVDVCYEDGRPLCTNFIQIAVLSMHQNGRDTHVRQAHIFAPSHEASAYKTPSLQLFATLR
jgi:anaphase-promoting complex subunit 10